jgi:hypothetical protein
MLDFFTGLFIGLITFVGLLLLTQVSEGSVVPKLGPQVAAYRWHMQGYVLIYSLMMSGCSAVAPCFSTTVAKHWRTRLT